MLLGVVRKPVVRRAGSGQRDCVLGVEQIEVCYAGRDRVLGVEQIEPRYAGVVLCRCGRRMPLATRRKATGAPNTPMQPTASRARSLVF